VVAVRAMPGWVGELEVRAEGWRADVLASGPGARKVAWEVQVSGIAAEAAAERTRRHQVSGVDTCWLATGSRSTLEHLPRITPRRNDGEPSWTVTVAAWSELAQPHGGPAWTGHGIPLARFVQRVCRQELNCRDNLGGWLDPYQRWTTLAAAQAYKQHQDRAAEAERERLRKHLCSPSSSGSGWLQARRHGTCRRCGTAISLGSWIGKCGQCPSWCHIPDLARGGRQCLVSVAEVMPVHMIGW
jgi:hypothetical protein